MSYERTPSKPVDIPARKTSSTFNIGEVSQSAPTSNGAGAAFFKEFHNKKISDALPEVESFQPSRPSSADEWRKVAFQRGYNDSQ